jgi:diadenosine tetraphosphate (Ap4A) HIT family hydrolase
MCLFCKIASERNFINIEDTILDESENFYAKPALGQFMKGYILINSKKHLLNYSNLDSPELHSELQKFIIKVSNKIKEFTHSELLLFEHGSINKYCADKMCSAKCIDHAHLHLLPLDFDIHFILKKNFTHQLINDIKELSTLKPDSYIYSNFQNNEYIYHVDKPIPSQFVRQIICDALNIGDKWNWKIHPFKENIIDTIELYRGHTDIHLLRESKTADNMGFA